jgi:hypothetical protein
MTTTNIQREGWIGDLGREILEAGAAIASEGMAHPTADHFSRQTLKLIPTWF